MSERTRPCVVGTCRCGGYGIVYDEAAQRETGVCHDRIPGEPASLEAQPPMSDEQLDPELWEAPDEH